MSALVWLMAMAGVALVWRYYRCYSGICHSDLMLLGSTDGDIFDLRVASLDIVRLVRTARVALVSPCGMGSAWRGSSSERRVPPLEQSLRIWQKRSEPIGSIYSSGKTKRSADHRLNASIWTMKRCVPAGLIP
jgi:hypothetical protein